MTISSTTRVAGPFIGAGTTSIFPFAFKVLSEQDMFAATLETETGAITVLEQTRDYAVALNPDQDSAPGGTITLNAGNLATGLTLTITTEMLPLQGLDLANGGGFYPDVINDALDRLTILAQQFVVLGARAILAPLEEAAPYLTLPPTAQRASMLLGFDASGNLTLYANSGGGGGGGGGGYTPVQASTNVGTITGAIPGSAFALPSTPVAGSLILQQNGQVLTPGVGYSLLGAAITLTTPLVNGDNLNANYQV